MPFLGVPFPLPSALPEIPKKKYPAHPTGQYINLNPGQYQFEDVVFGRGTMYPVRSVQIQSYEIAPQDYTAPRSNEMYFGVDSLVPKSIVFDMSVLGNYLLDNVPNDGVTPDLSAYNGLLDKLAKAWRGDEVRNSWNAMRPLRFCDNDGVTKVWYGRPRKFEYTRRTANGLAMDVQAEFQKADTLQYSDTEYVYEIVKGSKPTYIRRDGGDCDAWLRIIGVGPLTRPKVTIGEQEIDLDIELEEGEYFELSSYPWQRRVINSDGLNLSTKLIGDTRYLDQITLPPKRDIPIRWTSEEINTWIPDLGVRDWSHSINGLDFFRLPFTFERITGRVVVRFDLFNPDFAEFYISSGILGRTSAVLYRKKSYNGPNQFCQAKIVNPNFGRSAIAIMSNGNMTNYAMLEIESDFSGLGTNRLNIRAGFGPKTYSEPKASWDNTDFFGWSERDVIGIGSSFEPVSGNTTYTAYCNGDPVCEWVDESNLVFTGSANRKQGFIFDLGNKLTTFGIGFKDILAYDQDIIETPVGGIIVTWRDAYSAAP